MNAPQATSSGPEAAGPFSDVLRDIRERAVAARQQDLEHRAATSLVQADRMLVRIQERAQAVSELRGLLQETAEVLPGAGLSTGYYGGDERVTLRHVREARDDADRDVRILSEVSFQVLASRDDLQVVFRQTVNGRNTEPERWTFSSDEEGRAALHGRATRRLVRFVADCLGPTAANR